MPHHTLSFGRSSSPHYAAATALAAQIPGTTVTGGDGVAVHAVPLDAESLPAVGRQNLMRPTDTHDASLLAPAC